MSEFTDGVLILKSDTLKAKAALADLTHPHIFQNLNDIWSVIVLEHPDEPARPWIEQYSYDFPILSFQDAEDHGWGYIIFHEGKEKASVEVEYELADGFWNQIVRVLYPNMRDIYSDLDTAVSRRIRALVENSEGYHQEIKDQYTHANVDEFDVFDVSLERIAELHEIVRPEWYQKRIDGLQQVDAFKRVIGIQAMSWTSYDYLKRDQDEGRL